MKTIWLFLSLFITIPAVSCTRQPSSDETNQASSIQHSLGEPIPKPILKLWQNVDDTNISTFILPQVTGKVISDNDSRQAQVRHLLNSLDLALRKRFAPTLAHIPPPKVLLVENPEPNAFAAKIPVCSNVPLRFENANANWEIEGVTERISLSQQGEFELSSGKCLFTQEISPQDLLNIIQYVKPSCQARLDSNTVILNSTCSSQLINRKIHGSKQTSLLLNANIIVVQSGLLQTFTDEDSLRFVLAHEMAHYYRAHFNRPENMYNFFYSAVDRLPGLRPTFSQETQAIGRAFLSYRTWQEYPIIPAQTLNTQIFADLMAYGVGRQIIEKKCNTPEGCGSLCSEFLENSKDARFSKTIATVLRKFQLNDTEVAQYLKQESRFLNCSQEISLGNKNDPSSNKTSLINRILGLGGISRFPSGSIDQLRRDLEEAHTLQDASLRLTTLLNRHHEIKARITQTMLNEQIGLYTYEQEADDLGLEILHIAQISPLAGVRTLRKIIEMTSSTTTPSTEEIPAMQCLALQTNGWRNENNLPIVPPLASWNSPYHSDCYRLYNLDREIAEHY